MLPCKLHGNLWQTQDQSYTKEDSNLLYLPKYFNLITHFTQPRYNWLTDFLDKISAHKNVSKFHLDPPPRIALRSPYF